MQTDPQQPGGAGQSAQGQEEPWTPEQLELRQRRLLLRALEVGHPVMYKQRQRFLHTVSFRSSGGGLDTDVYLAGQADTVPLMEVTLDPNYSSTYSLK